MNFLGFNEHFLSCIKCIISFNSSANVFLGISSFNNIFLNCGVRHIICIMLFIAHVEPKFCNPCIYQYIHIILYII